MDRHFIKRRRLLTYLGLGAIGAGGAAIASGCSGKSIISTPTATQPAVNSTPAESTSAALPPNAQKLPEFQGISQWLNSSPLTTADLKGSVVLVQFWTFACINCQRTLPYVTRWHQEYADKGLKIVGVHTPEFAYEKVVNNVKQALKKHKINYAVPIDNEFQTWNAYKNEYWPHLFLADRQGVIRYDHIGEGAYSDTEQMIRQLLG
ncbi:redoxin [Nostoc sp. MBR 210]|uniref:Thioredoxin family protein n=1 Tax=Nostoc spongiaeforme FACHB-130 TaxID=1357510 RepID=A0ABR8FWY2_9NOSO|nr:thioredoxin family protein [Nostoc spongiaeforme]MBD2594629.1 thioredoxin family protein [Nostoc spongiaeforme FACHB-130]OCQ97386.1 redoxin [Nostoc sp. MBR 210]